MLKAAMDFGNGLMSCGCLIMLVGLGLMVLAVLTGIR